MDPRDFDRQVLRTIDPIMRSVTAEHLNLPSPCQGWRLGELLCHMIDQHRGFAAAAQGHPAVPQWWEGATLGERPYETYKEAADAVTAAFADPQLYDRNLAIYGYGVIPAKATLHMHAVDYLAHGWDVAKTIGVDAALDEALCAHGLGIALRWPESAFVKGDPFGAHVPVADDATACQKLMAYLGRDPHWTAH